MKHILQVIGLLCLFSAIGCSENNSVKQAGGNSKLQAIDFYDSPEVAEAHARLAEYKGLLGQGLYEKADSLAREAQIALAIPPGNKQQLIIFNFCVQCQDGKCGGCNGSGICSACAGARLCPACKGLPPKSEPCRACICRRCNGSGTCASCGGNGKVRCHACMGTGWGTGYETKPCPTCHGRGRIKNEITTGEHLCLVCKGVGKLTGARTRCTVCNGTGNLSCLSCNGSGRCAACAGYGYDRNCPRCRGTRKITVLCSQCNGTGKCNNCKGGGKCPACHGDGKCTRCAGTAVILVYKLPIDKIWLQYSSGIVTVSGLIAHSYPKDALSFSGRTFRLAEGGEGDVALVASPDQYVAVARLIMK